MAKLMKLALFLTLLSKSFSEECIVTKFDEVLGVTQTCSNVIIDNISVPAGETLQINPLISNSVITFRGNITFDFFNWEGPLVLVQGDNFTLQGEEGHILDGQGELYWDSKGSWGTVKPRYNMVIIANQSLIRDINMYNTPMHAITVNHSSNVVLRNIMIDNSEGAEDVASLEKAGHNTDGIQVGYSKNILVQDSTVLNQDDCVVLKSGTNITVSNVLCYGSHGLSMSVGTQSPRLEDNSIANVIFQDSIIINALNGIHIKNHLDARNGTISNITFRNIQIVDSTSTGINIEQNYTNSLVPGNGAVPINNIPIIGLTFENIRGTVRNDSVPFSIICAKEGCLNFTMNNVKIYGQRSSACVNFHPENIDCIEYSENGDIIG